MATKAEIAQQVKLERDQISQGLERLRANTKQLEDQDYASASVYGAATVQSLLPLLVERIKSTTDRIYRFKNGPLFAEIATYLADIEPEVAGAIASKLTVDKVFSAHDDSHMVASVTDGIGQAVEAECQMRHYERVAPGLLHIVKEQYWHNTTGTQQKLTIVRTMMNRADNVEPWHPWGRVVRVKLGGWLLDCIIEVSGWFVNALRGAEGRRLTSYYLRLPFSRSRTR